MKRRLLIGMALVVILTLAGMFLPAHQVAYAMTGSGTEGDPYIITDVDDLQAVESNLSAWYELGNNIDASATETWNGGNGFTPISAFTGHLDGKGYVISDIFIINEVARGKQSAIFYASTGTIQNLGVEDATVVCDEKAAILVGQNDGGTISNCYVTGSVTMPAAGSKGKNLAGFVGNNKGTISDCYTTASVTGIEKLGGFVGKQESGTLTNCYSTGAVTGTVTAFGFSGETRNVVEGVTYNDCFWDTETSGQATDYAGSFATGKTTAQMKQEATFTNWDFTNVWDIDEDATYPWLRVFEKGEPTKVGTQIGAGYPITISPSSMTPQQEWTTITVPVEDADTLADVNEVMVKLFYDSAGTDPDEAGFSADVQTCAILTWTRGGVPEWTIAPGSTTWAINTAGCSQPADSLTQGNWVFSFKVGKVATYSPGTDDWDIYAKATDAGSGTGEDYLRDIEMNWYGEITENTVSVDWGIVALDSGFTEDIKVTVSVTYICNGNYNKQIKTSSPWGVAPTVTLNPSGTPGVGEFSLKADDDLTLDGAMLVSTGYTTFGTGTQTDESGITEASNGIWLKTGSSGITSGVGYSGTIYYAITQ